MNRRGARLAAALAAIVAAMWLPAAAAPQEKAGADDEVQLSSDLVLVPVSVRRPDGGAVTDLAAADFALSEDGAPQRIAFFRLDAQPLDVVLLVDASESVEPSLDVIRRAAYEFAKQLRPQDRLSIVTFSTWPTIVLDWTTNDLKATSAALKAIAPKGGTALYGSVVAALHERYEASPPEHRRAMIVLTDGVDTLSSVTSRTAAEAALRREVTVYAISTGRILEEYARAAGDLVPGPERAKRRQEVAEIERAEEPLGHLADATGGRVLFPREAGDLGKSYAAIAGELRSRYLLGYYPPEGAPAGFHAISVATKRSNVELRARKGYFKN